MSEEYQQRLSEQVSDGGGCVEAWRNLNEERNDTSVERRKALSLIAAVTVGAGVSSQETAAASVDSDPENVSITTIKEKSEQKKVARQARSNHGFAKIRNRLRRESRSSGKRSAWKVTNRSDEVLRYTYSICLTQIT